jgi:vacuolar-type H+-ATPase subunit H
MDLDRLIATEQRLDEAIRAAREQAARLVADTEAELRRREAELEAEVEAAARTAAAETARERERREREVSQDAAAAVARYEALGATQVAAAAHELVDWLVAGKAAP